MKTIPLSTLAQKTAALVMALVMAVSLSIAIPGQAHAATKVAATIATAAAPSVMYQTHVQDLGWTSSSANGAISGTTGLGKRIEALRISLNNVSGGSISYQAHIADIGWQGWKTSGQVAGTTGQARRIEAIQVKLTGAIANRYSVMYRVHVAEVGWLAWTKDGGTAGSIGLALRVEAVQVQLVAKGTPTPGVAALAKPTFRAKGHSANIGWQGYVGEGSTIGTTGRSLSLEALSCELKDFDGQTGAISTQAHVQDIGWQDWVGSGGVAGTTGMNKRIEAVRIKLTGNVSKVFDVYYRTHVKDYGWLDWAKSGETAGSTGYGLPIEALQVKLVLKSEPFNRGGSAIVIPKASEEQKVQARLDQIANGTLRYDSNTVMKVGSKFTGTRASEQCKGYAKNVFYLCFKVTPGATRGKPNNYLLNSTSGMIHVGSYSSMTATRAKSLFGKARPGDFVQMRRAHGGSHSMIVYSVQSSGITVLQANIDGRNTVSKNTYTWAQLANANSGMSLYTASNYTLR